MQFFLQLVSQRWRKQSIASCSGHVTRCNLRLQLITVSKNMCNRCKKRTGYYFVQSLQKKNWILLCAIVASPKRFRNKMLRGDVTRCNLPATSLTMTLQRKNHRVMHQSIPSANIPPGKPWACAPTFSPGPGICTI